MKKTVQVTIDVDVTVDESKFTDEWMAEWRTVFYDFHTVDDHIQHIAQLEARGLLSRDFTEGYGPLADMGIEARADIRRMETEIIP